MHIVLAVHCFFPDHIYGTETYTLQLAHGLQAEGHDVTVLSAVFAGEPTAAEEVTRYEWQGVPVVCCDKNRNPNTRVKDTYYQPSQRALQTRILQELKPDLLHVTHLVNHTASLLEAAQTLGIPTIATFTDFFGFCYNNKLEGADGRPCAGPNRSRSNCLACHFKAAHTNAAEPWKRRLAQWPWSRVGATAAGLIARVSQHGPLAGLVADVAHRPATLATTYATYRLAITPTRLLRDAYLHNGITIPTRDIRFGVEIDRSPKPSRHAGTPLRLGFIGQIAYHKGPDLLIEAVRGLSPGAVELVIYGSHTQDPAYVKRLIAASAGQHVTFPGTFAPNRMAPILADLDVLCLPSRWAENGPLVLLNALATHTPVIVSDMGGMTEFLTPDGQGGYRDGLTFPMGELAPLRRIVHDLAANPARIRAMSAHTVYPRTSDDMVQDTLAAYRHAGLPA